MELTYNSDRISLSQKKLIEKGLELAGILDCRTVNTPMTVGIQLNEATPQERADFEKTRPDLAPAVSILSNFNNTPGINHWKQVIHCWKYLAATIDLKLILSPDSSNYSKTIQHFTDATWADDIETHPFFPNLIINQPISLSLFYQTSHFLYTT
ncbi:hypothetical protein VP01_1367g1 [Puccinia sorghi]|uniref:Uncharacterized protein n=1 Tax=Puccinia sorghi TaxID=27349 RepID=A0A0L6VNL1_9BASI|nr:hypothetical protein VP01_1367g1 [Puccinia sorghi]